MKRERFLRALDKHIGMFRSFSVRYGRTRGIEYDLTQEALSLCMHTILHRKKYRLIKPYSFISFIKSAIRYKIRSHKRDADERNKTVVRLLDSDLDKDFDSVVLVTRFMNEDYKPVEKSCPFCHSAILNMYGACKLCHTIIPSVFHRKKQPIAFTKESLECEFDFNKAIDVHHAVSQLTLFEQKIVRAVGLGNETLDSFIELHGGNTTALWRTWVKIKEKLQTLLDEYSDGYLSKQGPKAFTRAMQTYEIKG